MIIPLLIISLIVLFFIWRQREFVKATKTRDAIVSEALEPIIKKIEKKKTISAKDLITVASNPALRDALYAILETYNLLHLLPKKCQNTASLAEASMCFWLLHPNELGVIPYEIELGKQVVNEDTHRYFYVFKFRTKKPHWEAKRGWLAGVVGPYKILSTFEENIKDSIPTAFSHFEKWKSFTPEEHVKKFVKQMKL